MNIFPPVYGEALSLLYVYDVYDVAEENKVTGGCVQRGIYTCIRSNKATESVYKMHGEAVMDA
ncbi:MAG: hypothetical protein HOF74_10450 [Gammaproteobacteria bacterium]|nr:hypothetical protein [Gammaproteobacteria bacterium]MBT3860241.1 hypothetical protein [Gammaproteobacteria bacterium]MBT3987533.1 hypothetical protein [Gammaproteobacteria bacterium]MBT4255998.1 hypothetical protein [Gammaproteobacteria bacterium]MBT4581729.1 hypothetical protein [Gammaproteobacteria bacterium]